MPIRQTYVPTCLNLVTEGIVTLDREGRVCACNQAFEQICGWPAVELVGKPVSQLMLPEDYARFLQHWESLTESGHAQTFRVTAQRAGQQTLPASVCMACLPPGEPAEVILTIRDISEQVLLEEHQQELENRLRRETLMRHLAEVINESLDLQEIMNTATREVGRFFNVERVWIYRLFFDPVTQLFENLVCTQYCAHKNIEPVSEEEINFEKTMYRTMSREDFKRYASKSFTRDLTNMTLEQRVDTASSLEGGIQSTDWQAAFIRAKEMARKYHLGSMLDVAVEYKGLPYGKIFLIDSNPERRWTKDEQVLVQFVADQLGGALAQSELYTSEQNARQEAEVANRRKSEFLGMMSHELRTPLNAIIGFTEMTLKGLAGPVTDKQARYLKHVSSSGHHLLSIVNDLLDVTQIETGEMSIRPSRFLLKPVLDEVWQMLQGQAAQRQIMLSFEIDSRLHTLTADPARFRQILINLLNNAIKFNRDQGRVLLRLYPSADGHWLMGEVEDTGIGIPKEKQAELFKKFYQVDSRAARQHEGTGLGLAITRELLERHGGDIQVSSVPGQGATFSFRLPLESL